MHFLFTANTSWYVFNFRGRMIRELLEDGHKVSVLAPKDDYSARLSDIGCSVHALPMDNHGTSALRETALLFRFVRAFRRLRPDIVLSFSIKCNIYGALAARLTGVPLLPNVSGLGPAFARTDWLYRVVVTLYRRAFRHLPVVFFQNDDDRALFIEKRLVRAERTVRLAGSGVDLARFTAAPLPSDDAVVFLFFARLIWPKGVGEFVEAGRRLRAEGRAVSIRVLGFLDVNSREAIGGAQMKKWVDDGLVDYLGSSDDVRDHICAADCVVLPSYYREGVPRGLLEAAAMARPIVTTDTSGCRDVVEDGITGFLCTPRDVASLTSAMRRFDELPFSGRRDMGLRGRARMERDFDETCIIDTYKGWIEVLTEKKI